MGVILLVGSIGFLDLRLLGYARAVALDDLERALMPLALAGLAIVLASGTILFAADAAALAESAVFRLKLLLLVAAGANALAFRWLSALPLARALALSSLVLWLAIVIAGRMIAYL